MSEHPPTLCSRIQAMHDEAKALRGILDRSTDPDEQKAAVAIRCAADCCLHASIMLLLGRDHG